MTNICFILYDLSIIGGVERVVESLANKLSTRYVVHIISIHGKEVNPSLQFSNSIKIKLLKLDEGRLRQQLIKAFYPIKSYFKKNKIEIAFLEATFVGFIGSPLGLLSKTKIVFCDHGSFMSQYNDIEIRIIRKIASIFCNKVIVLTKRSMDDYKRYFRIKSKKITFIYNWISDSIIDEYRKYNLESKIILTAGRFTKEKGYDLLLQVAEKVLPLNPEWQWHIYGEGPLEQEYYNKAVSLGLENSLIFKGFVNNMNDVYENASIYVLPSYREGIPLVLLEAKAYKIPCVSFDILTGPNEIIEDAKNGYLIKPYDIEAMAACINKMIINPDIRQELSNKSYSNINKFREINIYDQ